MSARRLPSTDPDHEGFCLDAYRRRALAEEPDPFREGILAMGLLIVGIIGGPLVWVLAIEFGVWVGGR